jgi:cytochrome c peroxidase
VEERGHALFLSPETRCAGCHVPETEYTDRVAVPLRALPTLPGFSEEQDRAFKTPSLLYVGGTAPYFHDGSAATLEQLVDGNADRMGKTEHLSPEDRAALVAFLRTL